MTFLDFQSPSVANLNETSVTLQWNEPPPEMTGYPQRNITQYAVSISSQDGGEQEVALVPAEAGSNTVYTATDLQPATIYDIEFNVVIDTEGQGERTYDLGISSLIVSTRKYIKAFTGVY